MKFSVNWLREMVELPATVEELADLLTFAGVEIEGIERRGADIANVVVAQINASAPHPNADRLSVCQVDDGSGTPRQIVCGAKNFKTGDKVPLALPGAALPNGLKIRASKLRGVESQGMLCSPIELAISEESAGLLILSPDAPLGVPLGSLFPPDTILDVEITPNRSDLLSYAGLAREIAALRSASFQLAAPLGEQVGNLLHEGVKITAPRECPFLSMRRIENVSVRSSPDWLRAKLESAGIRPINNIVDITNFVMLELGQPMHAFDADKLRGGITARLAEESENFVALDGRTYSLGREHLMIADEERAVGIAGVMGGEETGVTQQTRNVLLEAAYFLPSSIRRTARTLNLPSDASYRFERGIDPAMTLRASARAVQLIREIAGGQPAAETMVAGELPPPPSDVALRYERCDRLLGVSVARDEVDRSLKAFGLSAVEARNDATTWQIPSFRVDLKREADLIEEVVRAHGINKIPGRTRGTFSARSAADRAADFQARVRQRLSALGFSEARTSALIPRQDANPAGAVELRNPLSEDHVALRPSLLPGLLAVLERNIRAGAQSVRLFELGRVFVPPGGTEEVRLALLCSGDTEARMNWRGADRRKLDFFDVKGAIEGLATAPFGFRRTEQTEMLLAVEILAGDRVIGRGGQLGGLQTTKLGASAPVFVIELQLSALMRDGGEIAKFHELDKFPAVTRDIAMIVPETVSHREIRDVITSAKEPLLAEAEVFDVFAGREGAAIGAGRKSMAYTLTYRSHDRTLTSDEVTVVHTRIRDRLKSELGAELRE